jgi:hypothetical protein
MRVIRYRSNLQKNCVYPEMYRSMDMIFWLPQVEATLAQVEAR